MIDPGLAIQSLYQNPCNERNNIEEAAKLANSASEPELRSMLASRVSMLRKVAFARLFVMAVVGLSAWQTGAAWRIYAELGTRLSQLSLFLHGFVIVFGLAAQLLAPKLPKPRLFIIEMALRLKQSKAPNVVPR